MLDYMMARAKASEGKSLKELKLQGHTSFKQVSIAMHNPTQIYTGVHNPTSCNPIITVMRVFDTLTSLRIIYLCVNN